MNPMKNASETSHPSVAFIHRLLGWHLQITAAKAVGILIASLLFFSLGASAQETYRTFLKIDGIPGDSTVLGHQDEIEVRAFSSGVENLTDNSGGGRASQTRPVFSPIFVAKNIDQTSPLLFVACATGKQLRKVTLTVAKVSSAGTVDFLKIVLSNVTITKVETSGDSGDLPALQEIVGLDYVRIEWIITTTDANGQPKVIAGGWDRRTNTSL
jgi:type VI secretion system secreted protein Hcp